MVGMAGDSTGFGNLLKAWRLEAQMEQKEAAAKITEVLRASKGAKQLCHVNELSTYENNVRRPKAKVLLAIAQVYSKNVYAVLQSAFIAEHIEHLPGNRGEHDLLMKHLEAGVEKLSRSTLRSLEREQLRSLTSFSRDFELLDSEGARTWEGSLIGATPRLECFWVASLDFSDNEPFFEMVMNNIKADVMYVYFIREHHNAPKARFDRFRSRMRAEIGDKCERLLRIVPFRQQEEAILALDFVVANPHCEDSTGFQTLWFEDRFYNVKLPSLVTRKRVSALEKYVTTRPRRA